MALAAAGCVSEPAVEFHPPMPRIVSNSTAPAESVAPAGSTVAEVTALAARGDIAGAQAAFARVGPVRQRDAAPVIARAMLTRDLNGAAQWANGLAEISARVAAIRAVAADLFQQDPTNAMDRLQAVPLTERRVEFLSLAAAEWARRDSPSAVAWAQGLDDGELRPRVLASIAFEVAQRTPGQAVEIAKLLPPGRDRTIALGAIGRTWAQRNSAAALQWAHELREGEDRNAAQAGIESAFGYTITPRSGFVDSREPGIVPPINVPPPSVYGATSDDALRREFQQRLERSPALTGEWLSTLPPGDRRDEFVTKLTHEWMAENPAAARQWVDQNIPSDARRQQILFEAGAASSPRPHSP